LGLLLWEEIAESPFGWFPPTGLQSADLLNITQLDALHLGGQAVL
jgi:hypothetical protein